MSDDSQFPTVGDPRQSTLDVNTGHTPTPEVKHVQDWRLLAIIGAAVLLLLAVIINKNFYTKGTPPSTPRVVNPIPAEETQRAPTPSPEALYGSLINRREMEVTETMFAIGDKTYLVARPPMPIRSKDDRNRVIGMRPGGLLDVSKCLEGVKPQMLHRRGLPRRREIAFMDIFPPLGLPGGVEMVTKGADEITLADVADTEAVIGINVNGEARAYPIRFANYHEVINDTLGNVPVVVSWSALANAASAMERRTDTNDEIRFGAAWLMYQGAIVLYDIETQSLWAPLHRQCIVGTHLGSTLKPVQVVVTSWSNWKKLYPLTTVLVGTNPLLSVNYEFNPAVPSKDYWRASSVLYPVYGFDVLASPMRMKSHVFGVSSSDGKTQRAYEANLLLNSGTTTFEDTINGQKVLLNFDVDTRILSAIDAEETPLFVDTMIWMCWSGLHPNTEVWQEDTLMQAYNRQTLLPSLEETLPSEAD